jgi:hypothetical protein
VRVSLFLLLALLFVYKIWNTLCEDLSILETTIIGKVVSEAFNWTLQCFVNGRKALLPELLELHSLLQIEVDGSYCEKINCDVVVEAFM